MEFLLDAAMILETYETCYNFYKNVVGKNFSIRIFAEIFFDVSQLSDRTLVPYGIQRVCCV